MSVKIEKYGMRNWDVWLVGGEAEGGRELVAVTVYKKGAVSVAAMAEALIDRRGVGVGVVLAVAS